MQSPRKGPILEEIGQLISEHFDNGSEGAYMYAEAGDNWQEISLFKDLGNRVVYQDPDTALFEALGRLWDAAAPDERWSVLEYSIADGRFTADFQYPDEIDAEELSIDRSNRALTKKFGDKPIDYGES